MTELVLDLPHGLETHMELLIEGGLYYTKDELIADAVRRLLEVKLETLSAAQILLEQVNSRA